MTAHRGGTYVCIEGPQFSTLAEAHVHRQLRFHIIGMTNVTEAKLAREAELCYGTIAMITDYDCWHPEHSSVTLSEIMSNLSRNAENAHNVLRAAVRDMPADRTCRCGKALAHAIVTDPAMHPGGGAAPVRRNRRQISFLGAFMSLLVVGSIAFDALETPFGKVDRTLGGAATYFSVSASCFTQVNLVGVVGDDFTHRDRAVFRGRKIDISGLERASGKTFFWSGRYGHDPNDRVTLTTELNVFATFRPKLPEAFCQSRHVFLANIDPTLQFSVLEQITTRPRTGGPGHHELLDRACSRRVKENSEPHRRVDD